MSDLTDAVDQIQPHDPFGFACTQLMKKIAKMGYTEALAREIANCEYRDPDYAKMVVALSIGKEHTFPTEQQTTYKCGICKDHGYTMGAAGSYVTSTRCPTFCIPPSWQKETDLARENKQRDRRRLEGSTDTPSDL